MFVCFPDRRVFGNANRIVLNSNSVSMLLGISSCISLQSVPFVFKLGVYFLMSFSTPFVFV